MDNVSTKHSDTPLTSSALLLVFLLSIACQLTDVALGPVKLWELMAISIFPLTIRKIEKRILIFFSAFLMLLILSLMKGFFADIHYQYFSALKSKYVISIVRFIELILCLIVTLTPYNIVRNNKGSVESIIKVFLTFNLYITLFIFILFVSDVLFHTGLVSYGVTHRLRGLYVEGGPYGLFISTLILLELTFFKRKLVIFVFLLALMLSQSKAGIISCFLLVTYYIFIRSPLLRTFINPKKIIRFSITMIFLAGLVLGVTYKVAYNYYDDLNNVDDVLASRINDTSFVMGRIAATHIGPNIISDNPVAGVGLGAYSLVRNNIQYRQQFPFVSGWDLTGLGGLTTLAIENGFLGLGIFLFATLLYFSFNLLGGYFILLFLFPFVLGAQLYMVYPWFYLGLYACLRKKR